MAELALIAAAAWGAIVLIVLAICRAAKRDDKPEDADREELPPKARAVTMSAPADGRLDRPSRQE